MRERGREGGMGEGVRKKSRAREVGQGAALPQALLALFIF